MYTVFKAKGTEVIPWINYLDGGGGIKTRTNAQHISTWLDIKTQKTCSECFLRKLLENILHQKQKITDQNVNNNKKNKEAQRQF